MIDARGLRPASVSRTPMPQRVVRGPGVAIEVNADHAIPLFLGDVDQRGDRRDAGVVYQDVEVAERIDREPNELAGLIPVGDVMIARHRLSAGLDDLIDDALREGHVFTLAVRGSSADVVDDDARALRREFHRIGSTKAAPGSGNDRYAPGQTPAHLASDSSLSREFANCRLHDNSARCAPAINESQHWVLGRPGVELHGCSNR